MEFIAIELIAINSTFSTRELNICNDSVVARMSRSPVDTVMVIIKVIMCS